MENNRQFELMRSAARQKLEGADPVQLSVLTGLCWDGRTFDTETLGIPIRISWPECQISPALEMWHDLTILQYLANTKGTTLMGKFLALSEFRSGGLAKGTSFDRDNDRIISRIGLHDPQAIREAAAKLGGTELQEKSDLSFLFSFLPHIPIKFNLWLPDEEFSASGKILFDASAENDLQIEAAGTAAAICRRRLPRAQNTPNCHSCQHRHPALPSGAAGYLGRKRPKICPGRDSHRTCPRHSGLWRLCGVDTKSDRIGGALFRH